MAELPPKCLFQHKFNIMNTKKINNFSLFKLMVMKKGAGSNGLLSLWTGFTLFYVCLKWLIENITRPEKKFCLNHRISNTRNEFVLEFLIDKRCRSWACCWNPLPCYLLGRNWCVEGQRDPFRSLSWYLCLNCNKMNLSFDSTYYISLLRDSRGTLAGWSSLT